MASCVRRNIESHINELLNHFPSVVLEGARQVGKSTLAAHAAPDGSVLLNLDRQETRDAAISDPEGFVAAAGDGTLVIDEIQRVPALTLAIKALIDADRRPGRFLLTGSSSLLRVRGTADSLAGRAARVRLYGLSQGEMRGSLDDLVHSVIQNPNALVKASSTCSSRRQERATSSPSR